MEDFMSKDSKARHQKGKLLSFIPNGEYYFSKGIKAYHRRDFHKAKKYLMRAMQLEPGEPMIICQLAIVHSEMGEYQESNQLLHMILEELDEDMVECHYFLANNYAHMGLFKDAYTHANTYLDLDRDGEFTEDTEDLLELLTLEGEDLDDELYEQDDLITKQEHARELLESGHFPKAVEILNSVIDEYPEYWSAYNNLALAYFYLGEVQKAADILEKVLEENPGNLHALCNKLVFAFYERDFRQVRLLKEALKKIKPLSIEHQFKLGATFALTGEYEAAFAWLRKLQKKGFEGDGPFYYWLSYSAYFTGREEMAKSAWKKAIEINPEKEGFEPWNDEKVTSSGFEDLFLTSVSSRRDEILISEAIVRNNKFSAVEKEYLSFVKTDQEAPAQVQAAHETAELFYENYHPIGTVEAGLYLMWFTIFAELTNNCQNIKNNKAWAAAIEYVWHKLRNEKVSQSKIAGRYGISASTMGKYVKSVNDRLQ
jgi:tetratricopeptide (TPR) repeat protein